MGYLLTAAERERFATYLEQEATTADEMAKQMETIKVPAAFVQKVRSEALAARIIAAKLRSITTETVCG